MLEANFRLFFTTHYFWLQCILFKFFSASKMCPIQIQTVNQHNSKSAIISHICMYWVIRIQHMLYGVLNCTTLHNI